MGVVTGIVQEFQFGMNWSDYSRFVGDVFGAPLAIEGLLAFFLESTFLGLWIFGWDRLPQVHLACIWLVHVGTLFSAYFILAANSWMQHPVGYQFNPDTGRAELTDFGAVLTNKVQLVTFPHIILSAFITGGAFVVGIAVWHLTRQRHPERPTASVPRGRSGRGAAVLLVAGLGVAITGDMQGKIMTEVQPMKMAAAEALYDTERRRRSRSSPSARSTAARRCSRSRSPDCCRSWRTGTSTARSRASTTCAQYEETYGQDPGAAYYSPGDYTPIIPVTYWTLPADDRPRAARGADRRRWILLGHPPRRGAAADGCCGGRLSPCRSCRCSPTPSAGSSPRWAASPGSVFGLMTTEHARLAGRQHAPRCSPR